MNRLALWIHVGLAHGQSLYHVPQTLPVLQDAAAPAFNEDELPPEALEANVEIFFFIWVLPQMGQVTLSVSLALRSSSSKGWPQCVQLNSKSGINISV